MLSSVSVGVWADPVGADHAHPMMWDGSWTGMLMGPLTGLVFIAALVLVVVALVRWLGAGPRQADALSDRRPVDILSERFARGEIDQQEYEERRRVLGD